MKRCQSGVCDARARALGSSSVHARRGTREKRQHKLLLKADAFREHGHPRLRDGRLLLEDHAGEFLAITGTERRPDQGHARESMRNHLGCRESSSASLTTVAALLGFRFDFMSMTLASTRCDHFDRANGNM